MQLFFTCSMKHCAICSLLFIGNLTQQDTGSATHLQELPLHEALLQSGLRQCSLLFTCGQNMDTPLSATHLQELPLHEALLQSDLRQCSFLFTSGLNIETPISATHLQELPLHEALLQSDLDSAAFFSISFHTWLKHWNTTLSHSLASVPCMRPSYNLI